MASVMSGPCVCAAPAAHTSLSQLHAGCLYFKPRQMLSRSAVLCKGNQSRPRDGGEHVRFEVLDMAMQSCLGRNVCEGCVVSRSEYRCSGELQRSFQGSRRSSRRLRSARLVSECGPGRKKIRGEQNWVLDLAQSRGSRGVSTFATGGEGQGTQVENVASNSNDVEDLNSEAKNWINEESRVGGDGDAEIEERRRDVNNVESEERRQPSLTENMDNLGKVAESATEKLLEDSGGNLKSAGGSRMPQMEEENLEVGLKDAGFWRQVAMAADAGAALGMIAERVGSRGGVVGIEECSMLILDALAQGNGDLAFSVLKAMRSSVIQRRVDRDEKGSYVEGWRWAQPNVSTYATLVRGLATSLRVADAIEVVADVRRRGVPAGDEVPFGKVVNCPTCKTALAVVQPQQGVQVAPCAKCRYQYELMSGTVVECESESIGMNISVFERGLRVVKLLKRPLLAAVHSIVVRAPNGVARTHRCATESADIPAQEGERVTVISAAPANSGLGIGPLKISARAPGWRPSEPMAITNHVTGRVSSLSRPPPKSGSETAFDASFLISAALFFACSDAATVLIDPSFPRAIAIGAATAVAVGGATSAFVLPRLNQLPQRTVDALALRQQLLAQHEGLQARLQDLTQAAADDVRMLARMCQLQNKMEAVNEPTYSARMERVQKARETLDERLEARLELIYSYAKIASMIEIEVEMDIDVLAAEGAGATAIAEQIERLMEVEDLQKAWRLQAEANDEVERLLQSAPLLNDSP